MTDLSRSFVEEVRELAAKYDLSFFIVTERASAYSNRGNAAVKNAREAQIEWERRNGFDPEEDWSKEA